MSNKKRVHTKCDPTSNRNNSESISQNHLKFGVSRLTIVDYSLINFQVNRTYPSRVIAVGSWVRFCVDSFFIWHPLVYSRIQYGRILYGYLALSYGTVYGRILGEDMVWYSCNLKLRLRSIPTNMLRKLKRSWYHFYMEYGLDFIFRSIEWVS